MLGAALQSVDALMIPSSTSMGGKETTVNRKLSQKDIAALHTGSNSMQQFAEQFGTTHIKQADRSPEDAERIGRDYLDDMYATPEDYVADADGDKLDYSVRMSDGKPFDINNPRALS
jgi:N-methylhydantoinase B/oxoprolinase/acetone carboxylase alpha subunit